MSSVCRESGKHGGSAIYTRRSVKCKERKDLSDFSVIGHFECAAVECWINKTKLIVLSVYRPCGGSLDVFLEKMEMVLASVGVGPEIIVSGDFNIDLLESTNVGDKIDFLSLMSSVELTQTINEPTRVTINSSSCLDNIFTSFHYSEYESQILRTVISDHFGQKISLKFHKVNKSKPIFRRFFTPEHIEAFRSDLGEQDWVSVFAAAECDVNSQWKSFMDVFLLLFHEKFPQKLVHVRKVDSIKMFETQEIRECKNRLDNLLLLRTHHKIYDDLYKIEKKNYESLLVKSKASYYGKKIQSSDNKSKMMWSIVNDVTGKNYNNECGVEGSPSEVSNKFSKFFDSLVQQLAKEITDIPFVNYSPEIMEVFTLTPVSPEEIVQIINSFKNKHCSGYDEVPLSLIKSCSDELKTVISYIVNNSFKFGIFPDQLKYSLIKPIFKKGNKNAVENYRPISLLPSFSRIFEKAMSARLLEFCIRNRIFSESQHGYLGGRSPITAIFQFTHEIIKILEDDKLGLGLFIDQSRAYDCLNHDYLLQKLERMGVRNEVKKWFESYLGGRHQKVVITVEGVLSESEFTKVETGVPQGSVLGPLLFILYVNDLCILVEYLLIIITCFVDDTNVLLQGETFLVLKEKADEIFTIIKNWLCSNKLKINEDKTAALIFSTDKSRRDLDDTLQLGNRIVVIEKSTKFLGLHVDRFLKWYDHIEYLSIKLSKISFGIRTLSKYISEKELMIVYFANAESIMRYGIIFWGSSSAVDVIFRVQKKIVRIMYHMSFRESCRGVFKKNGILTLYALYIFECLVFFFKHREVFEVHTTHHNYRTRSENLHYPIHRLSVTEKHPSYMCIKLFNALPSNLRISCNLNVFKKRLKNSLINIEPYSLSEYFEATKLL